MAQSRAEYQLGPVAPPEIYEQLRTSGRFEYVFDIPSDTRPPGCDPGPMTDSGGAPL